MLIEFNKEKFGKNEIILALQDTGVTAGDTICVHSELFKLGKMLKPKDEFLYGITEALCKSVGLDLKDREFKNNQGTILMPTFTYEFCQSRVYDKKHSKSEVGILGEYFRKLDGVYRSDDPVFSFAIFGRDADKYKGFSKSCFGENSIFKKMIDNNVKFVIFGTTDTGCTLVHYCEELLQVPYRYYKDFDGKIIDENNNEKDCNIKYFVRKLDTKSKLSVSKMRDILIKDNAIHISNFAGAQIAVMEAKKYFNSLLKALKDNNSIFLRDS